MPRLAVLALLLASAPAGASGLPTGTIELFQSESRVLVMMRVGDGELVPMVFDTGSDGHSFDRLMIAHNRLKRVGETIEHDGTTGKRRTLPVYAIPDATIGGLHVGRIDGAGLDYDRSDAMGIISSEMFAGHLVALELGANRARILPKGTGTTPTAPATPYQGGLPAVSVTMPDGSTLAANLDTGFDGPISLPVAMMGKVPLMAPAKVVGRFKSINTEGEVYGGQVRGTIAIGPLVLKDPEVTFLGETTNIGLPLMRKLTIMLDPAEKLGWVLSRLP
jgi:hypothetical protein